MYDLYIVKRTQIYLDESQDERLSRRAKAAGTTKSELIRQAVEAYLTGGSHASSRLLAFRAAVGDAAGTVPRLPKGSDYVDGVRRGDTARQHDLEARQAR